MWLGRYQLGDYVPLQIRCVNSSGVPTLPADNPTAYISDNTGSAVENFKVPIKDRYHTTALFQTSLRLDSSYAAGRYSVFWEYNDGSQNHANVDWFEVMGGGDTDGTLTSLEWYERPHGPYVVMQDDNGTLKQGRGPK